MLESGSLSVPLWKTKITKKIPQEIKPRLQVNAKDKCSGSPRWGPRVCSGILMCRPSSTLSLRAVAGLELAVCGLKLLMDTKGLFNLFHFAHCRLTLSGTLSLCFVVTPHHDIQCLFVLTLYPTSERKATGLSMALKEERY